MDNRQAIEILNKWIISFGDIAEMTEDFRQAIDHAIAVMQKPVSEEVQRSIEWATAWHDNNILHDAIGDAIISKTVLQALRQMRTESCLWCATDRHKELLIEYLRKAKSPNNFCPSCGRKLKDGDDSPKAEPATYKPIIVSAEEAAKWQTMRSDEVWG